MKKIIVFILFLVTSKILPAQVSNISPMLPCCDNGLAQDANYQADSIPLMDVVNIDNNCRGDIPVTPRQCVNRTRDGRICGGALGSKYCHEVRHTEYPRYYALWHPIIVSTHSMSFSIAKCAGNPSSQIFSITNGVWQAFQIDYTLNWNATKTQSWLTISPSSGTVSDVEPELQKIAC